MEQREAERRSELPTSKKEKIDTYYKNSLSSVSGLAEVAKKLRIVA